jgi:predicted nucleic acid-binding protein
MKVLLDTNILLDVALAREPFWGPSAEVLEFCQQYPGTGAIAWHTVSNLAYMLKGDARAFLEDLLAFVDVASGSTASVREALAMKTRDLEDALQAASAITFKAQYVITRNVKDFRNLPIEALSPSAFLLRLGRR